MTMPEHVTTWHDARYDMPVSRQLERYNELAAKNASGTRPDRAGGPRDL